MNVRVLLWEDCPKSCEKCCNKAIAVEDIPVETDFSPYEDISFTGGEPMLYPEVLFRILRYTRLRKREEQRIFLYSSRAEVPMIYNMLPWLDGVTFTLHDPEDTRLFKEFLRSHPWHLPRARDFSLRLRYFKEAELPKLDLTGWDVKAVEWLDECPLPEGEVLRRYGVVL